MCDPVTAICDSEVRFDLRGRFEVDHDLLDQQVFSWSVAATREKKSGCQESASDLCSGIRAFLRFRCCC